MTPLRLLLPLICATMLVTHTGCMTAYKRSVAGPQSKIFNRIYMTDFNNAWQAVLEALKHNRLDISNREAGFVQTRWTENTTEKAFSDSYGVNAVILKAQFRFSINVAKVFYDGKPAIKVTVMKEQLVQRDVLEGWRPIESDTVEENTLLYRIGRIIWIKKKLAEEEKKSIESEIKDTDLTAPAVDSELDGGPPTTPPVDKVPSDAVLDDTTTPPNLDELDK